MREPWNAVCVFCGERGTMEGIYPHHGASCPVRLSLVSAEIDKLNAEANYWNRKAAILMFEDESGKKR